MQRRNEVGKEVKGKQNRISARRQRFVDTHRQQSKKRKHSGKVDKNKNPGKLTEKKKRNSGSQEVS